MLVLAEGTVCADSGLKCGWRELVAGDEPERLVGPVVPTNNNEENASIIHTSF